MTILSPSVSLVVFSLPLLMTDNLTETCKLKILSPRPQKPLKVFFSIPVLHSVCSWETLCLPVVHLYFFSVSHLSWVWECLSDVSRFGFSFIQCGTRQTLSILELMSPFILGNFSLCLELSCLEARTFLRSPPLFISSLISTELFCMKHFPDFRVFLHNYFYFVRLLPVVFFFFFVFESVVF